MGKILIIGVGGAGANTVKHMKEVGITKYRIYYIRWI